MLEPFKDNCSEIQEHGWLNYWTERNILINLLAILIIAANISLIFIILRSPKLRAEVSLLRKARKLFFCEIIKRFNLVILSLAITDMLCGFLIPFDTLRKHRWREDFIRNFVICKMTNSCKYELYCLTFLGSLLALQILQLVSVKKLYSHSRI